MVPKGSGEDLRREPSRWFALIQAEVDETIDLRRSIHNWGEMPCEQTADPGARQQVGGGAPTFVCRHCCRFQAAGSRVTV